MTANTTLRHLAGLADRPAAMADSTLIMIDCQNTYTEGVLELKACRPPSTRPPSSWTARAVRGSVIHVMHDAGAGSPYDVRAEIGQIVDQVAPREGEPVVVKAFPNAFTGTDLHQRLAAAPGRT